MTVLGPHVPELRALELLVVVARTGSLGAAAAELGISQQAASSRVRTMEALVGEPLVARSTRGSQLTPTGELVVQWAAEVLHAAQKLDAGITSLRTDRRAHLDIAASLTIAEHLLPDWLVGLRAQQVQRGQHPTEIRMTATNTARVTEMVASGERLLGLRRGPGRPGRTAQAPRRHRRARRRRGPDPPVGRPLRAPDLRRSARRDADGRPRGRLRHPHGPGAGARDADWQVAPALELSSTAAVRAAVAAGAGPAAVGADADPDDLATGRLVRINVADLDLTRRLHAVWKGGAHPPEGPARELVAWAAGRSGAGRSKN